MLRDIITDFHRKRKVRKPKGTEGDVSGILLRIFLFPFKEKGIP
ncbi:hypothetical protein HOLDEFILI_01059 [Holdemania filiformis DSM 12042]|uniref:Uncharacterized protein n=1 Tax=Holdemania filiformis DSM 12042 TaxID=545696 RepID=B9Y5H6_9FIRM|nr:hypothetical protein HOLDEFILI_01059 [Holdemania filiformis DSM 12042]